MDCLLPDVLDALAGGPVPDARMVAPPPFLGASGLARASASADGPAGAPARAGPVDPAGPIAEGGRVRPRKQVYGEPLAFHLDGPNFTVQWSDPAVDPSRAADLLAQLEAAWRVLVVDERWPAPVSSDEWLLWVILEPDLGGSGYTTVYTDDRYPAGYPVTWLDPVYDIEDPAFGLSVAVHELGHMLQYRLRALDGGRAEAWYWEATSEWVAERAAPGLDTYAESTWWYAQWPDAPFDAYERFHPYGMVLLNAWLDERAIGFDGIRRVWTGDPEATWEVAIAEEAGRDFGEIVADMAAEVAAGTLRESALYAAPVRGDVHDVAPAWTERALPGRYGSVFVDVGGGAVVAEGPVRARFVQDGAVLDAAPDAGPYTAVFTAVGAGDRFGYGTTPPGPAAGGAPAACGTAGGAPVGVGVGLLAGAIGVRRRPRVSRPTPGRPGVPRRPAG